MGFRRKMLCADPNTKCHELFVHRPSLPRTKNLENVKMPEEIRALTKVRARNENVTITKSNKAFIVRMLRPEISR